MSSKVAPRRTPRASRFASLTRGFGLQLAALGAILGSAQNAHAAGLDALSVAMFADDQESLWPIEIAVEWVDAETGEVIYRHVEETLDGQARELRHRLRTSTGALELELDLSARAHVGGAVELDYTMRVHRARYESMGVGEYLLHRSSLGPAPKLGPAHLSLVRGDIASVNNEAVVQTFARDGREFELRVRARSLRG